MKTLQLLMLLFIASPVTAGDFEKELAFLDFYVLRTEKDPSLKAGESVFEFQFTNEEFKQHASGQYPVLYASHNGTAFQVPLDKTLKHELKTAPGTYRFQFFATFNYEEIYSDSVLIQSGFRTTVLVHFAPADREIMMDKPVIYLYPEVHTDVTALVVPNGSFRFTYPLYENGWKGTAHPDGSMTIAGKNYPYLFWDAAIALDKSVISTAEGFIVQKDRLVPFLEEKLTAMGLTATEQTDFITYWGPRMAQNEENFIQFAWGGTCDAFAEMSIQPQPDHVNRLYMLWSESNPISQKDVTEQVLPVFDRSGFDVLEWGGSEIPSNILLQLNASTH